MVKMLNRLAVLDVRRVRSGAVPYLIANRKEEVVGRGTLVGGVEKGEEGEKPRWRVARERIH